MIKEIRKQYYNILRNNTLDFKFLYKEARNKKIAII